MHRKIAFAVCSALLLAACGGGGGDSPTGPVAPVVRLLTDTARVGALLEVVAARGAVPGEIVSATLGGAPISLARTGDSTLALLVPELPAGSSTLVLTANGQSRSLPVTILAPLAIANPVASINAAIDLFIAAVPLVAPVGIDPTLWAGHRRTLDSLVTDARAKVAATPAAEQLALARLLASMGNPDGSATAATTESVVMRDITASQAAMPTYDWSDPTCRFKLRQIIRSTVIVGIAGGVLAKLIVLPMPPIFQVPAVALAAVGFYASLLDLGGKWVDAAGACQVQEGVSVSSSESSELQMMRVAATSPTTAPRSDRSAYALLQRSLPPTGDGGAFFKDIESPLYPVIIERSASREEIALDSDFAIAAAAIDRVYELAGVAGRSIRGLLPLPPRVSQLVADDAIPRPIAASAVRFENFSPSGISLTTRAEGTAIMARAVSSATQQVDFSYDVVSVANPMLRSRVQAIYLPQSGFISVVMLGKRTTFEGEFWHPFGELDKVEINDVSAGGCRFILRAPSAVGVYTYRAPTTGVNRLYVRTGFAVQPQDLPPCVGSPISPGEPGTATVRIAARTNDRVAGTFSGNLFEYNLFSTTGRVVMHSVTGSFDVRYDINLTPPALAAGRRTTAP